MSVRAKRLQLIACGPSPCKPYTLRQKVIAAVLLLCAWFSPSESNAALQIINDEDCVAMELSAMGKPGDTVARARQQVLAILEPQNACSAWFQQSDTKPAEVFRSLHFELERDGPSRVYGMRNPQGQLFFKHPWAARAIENAGRDSVIRLNANGPFFNRSSPVVQRDSGAEIDWPSGNRVLTIADFNGDTPEAQITILLHELGHIIGRLPADDGSWDGRSVQNTAEVLRHCKSQTSAAAHLPVRANG
jgi:hypothetical protein